MDTMKWLKKATLPAGNARGRDYLRDVHGYCAADGCRLHLDRSIEGERDEWARKFEAIVAEASAGKNRAVVSKVALVVAARAARSLRYPTADERGTRPVAMVVRLNGRLDCEAMRHEVGTVRATFADGDTWVGPRRKKPQTIRYTHEGPEIEFAIDPKFVLDALEGFPEDLVRLAVDDAKHVYLAQGAREAVIMQMHLGR